MRDFVSDFVKYNHIISNIVFCGYVEPSKSDFVCSDRQSHGLAFYPNNSFEYCFEGKKPFRRSSGVIIYMPKGSAYTVPYDEKDAKGCFAINFTLANDMKLEPFILKVRNVSNFYNMFNNASKNWKAKQTGYKKICTSILYSILYNLEKEYETGYISKSNIQILMPAIDYIHKNYTKETISIPYLCELCSVSEGYFRRLFKKHTTLSPIKYINNLKIEYTKELICSGNYTLREIAELSGYADSSVLSREFKRIVGVAPSEYKDNKNQ